MKKLTTLIAMLLMTYSAIAFGPTEIRVTPPAPKFTDAERHTELAKRRAAVAAAMSDNSVMVLFSAEPKMYSNDVDYVFRQENNLYYLTALKQKDATLIIEKAGGKVTETLYIPDRIPSRETWNGHMYSKDEATALSGITNIADASTLNTYLNDLKQKSGIGVYLLLPENERDSDGKREFAQEYAFSQQLSNTKTVNAQPIFADLRQIKSPYEIKMLQHAVDISTEGHMRTWATAGRASMEYEVQAEFEYTLRRRNADYWGYPSIVGCGPNATTLHYEESQSPVTKGSLMLIDAAAEYEHYSADVTRTFPVNGKFTKEQAEVYQIVFDAQEAVAKAAKPGVTMKQLEMTADEVLQRGLIRLGLVPADTPQMFRIWYMHGFGHWLGMNVHDVGQYSKPLAPGMTFTNEPGIYIRADALDYLPDTAQMREFKKKVGPAFEKYKNIGVRIEDDMLVTPTGVEWMTKELPRKIADIEAFMAVAPQKTPISKYRSPKTTLFPYMTASYN